MTNSGKPLYGIILIIFAVFMMSVQDALFKYLSSDYALWQLFTVRACLALPAFMLIFRLQNLSSTVWRQAMQPWVLVRAALFSISFIALYAAMPFVGLSTVAAGYYTAPIFVTLLAVIFLQERINWLGWLAVLLGFGGVLVILQPGSEAFSLWVLLPVLGGFSYASANIITRLKCQQMPAAALALSLNVVLLSIGGFFSVMLLALPLSSAAVAEFPFLLGDWSWLSRQAWGAIIGASVLVIAIAMCVARAYQIGTAAVIATFEYVYLIFVALWDFAIFNSPPSLVTVLGVGLIVFSGVLISRQ